jgi:NitT/TauT family transport system ATP-binding protein
MSSAPLVAFRDVEKSYFPTGKPRFIAVENFTLDVADGEFFCLLGPSGCGKTTVLNMLAGFEAPTSGTIEMDGVAITAPSRDRGVVFQGDDSLYGWLTARENVEFGPRLSGVSAGERREIATRYLELVGMRAQSEKRPHELSGGMKQRTQIARVLANEPKMLLMDEPFAALDAQTRRVLQQELVKIWQATRKSVLFITHDIDEAIILGTRIGVMTAGPAARLKEVIVVDESVGHDRRHPSFMEFFKIIHALIEEEVNKTLLREQDTQSSSVGGTQA